MGRTPGERERAAEANQAEAKKLLAEARAARREAECERHRARRLAGRLARKMRHALAAARAQLDADRAAIDARVHRFNEARSEFHAASAADRDRLRDAWAALEAGQRRLAAEWEEANRFQAEQAAALAARAAELAARASAEADARPKIQREVAALREEAAALDARVRNARETVEELERRRAGLQAQALSGAPGAEPPAESQVALDRTADRDLARWAAELEEREAALKREAAAAQALAAGVAKDVAELADRRRVLAEQFAQLAAARAQWQEAERATVAEMEQLAGALRRREAELDARSERATRADARRREDAYELWQLRMRLEAWQSKIVAYEMHWHTEREWIEADFARREAELLRRHSPLAREQEGEVPMALPVPAPEKSAELAALRDELERLAAVLLEAELPEPPDPPEGELPWGSEDVPEALAVDGAEVLLFEPPARAA